MIVSNMYFTMMQGTSFAEIRLDNIVYAIVMGIFIYLIVHPKKFILYALVCCFLGVEGLFRGSGTEAFLIYIVGLFFAYASGVLLKHKFITVIFFTVPIIALLFQYRLGNLVLFDSIIDLIFIVTSAVFSYFLLKETFVISKKGVAKSVSLSCLSSDEVLFIKDVVDGKSFYTIAIERYKSESSVKQIMVGIYKKIGIESKKELLEMHKNNLLHFPE